MTGEVDPSYEAVGMDSEIAELAAIAKELALIARSGEVLPGSIGERRTRCGRLNCACHAEPPRLHGPYYQWTRKVAAKTVGRWLSPDQAEHYRPFVENAHRMRELLGRLETLGLARFEAETAPGRVGQKAVDEARAARR